MVNVLCDLPYEYQTLFSRKEVVTKLQLETDMLYYINISLNKKHFQKDDIMKTYLYNYDPLKPHFYIVKLGFTGVYIILLFLLKNIDCGYSLEPPRRSGSNEYPQSMF